MLLATPGVSLFAARRGRCSCHDVLRAAVVYRIWNQRSANLIILRGAREGIAMKGLISLGAAILACAVYVGLAVYSVGSADYCPQPSAASVTTLFAPCQAFDTAMGRRVTKKEAVQMGLLTSDEQPASPSTRYATRLTASE
jgi:hypothetical protein